MPIDRNEIEKRFTYHPPHGDQVQRYEYIRDWTKWLALQIINVTPESREQSLAITHLEEASMMANAAIARHEVAGAEPPINQESSEIAHLKEQLNNVYAERNMCVALIYHMARKLGYNYGIRRSSDFEPNWENCAMIDLPTGQVSWHFQKSEEDWLAEGDTLRAYAGDWDGHDTNTKYQRVLRYGHAIDE